MPKQIFKFSLGTILKMPGFNEAPGTIRSRIEHDDSPPEYYVQGVQGPRRAPSNFFTEGQLIEANPPIAVPEPHVIAARKKKGRR